MCAINGFNFSARDLILKMNQVTRHRGPDATDVWFGKNISLGHNRLSIIDLSERGAQPMHDASGALTVVFNGEIYNFKELRRELETKYRFRSESDTEVILYAYKEYGAECVRKLNGIFAFAIWDANRDELFLARDQSGVKPLYYFWDPSTHSGQAGRFIFSSEIKGILVHDVPREVDRESFNLYMRMLYVPSPYTMFSGIKKLPPAHYAVLNGTHFTIRKYWEVSDFSALSSREEAVGRIRELFRDSVTRQLISDRPVGVFLSGGIDSSAVLGAIADAVPGKLKTYSAGFKVSVQAEKFNADFELAEKTATHYGTDHHPLTISGKDIGNNLEKIAWHLDEPNANPTAGAIYLLSRLAKKRVAVVLGGDGADELFGGYRRYAVSRMIRRLGSFREPLSALLKMIGKRGAAEKLSLKNPTDVFLSFLAQKEGVVKEVIPESLDDAASVFAHFKQFCDVQYITDDFEKRFMNVDRQSWLVDDSLLRSDKMSMASGLEERVPVLDYRLIELAYRIPTKWKIKSIGLRESGFQGKQIWKEAIAHYIPTHLRGEKKRGWFTPMAKWIRTDLREQVSEILSPANLNPEFFNANGVQKMWQDHLESRTYNLNLIWAIVMWQLWYDTFIKRVIR